MFGFGIATYLALYQWGVLGDVWEPFFGEGSVVVLGSSISRFLPFPDAALGALGYLMDAVTGVVGGRERWRTMPWLVVVFGLAVGPLGAVSVLLVILQPVVLDAWCTLCLAPAAVSLLAPWPLGYAPAAVASSVASGAVLVALAFAGGRTSGRYGGGWSSLFRGRSRASRG